MLYEQDSVILCCLIVTAQHTVTINTTKTLLISRSSNYYSNYTTSEVIWLFHPLINCLLVYHQLISLKPYPNLSRRRIHRVRAMDQISSLARAEVSSDASHKSLRGERLPNDYATELNRLWSLTHRTNDWSTHKERNEIFEEVLLLVLFIVAEHEGARGLDHL